MIIGRKFQNKAINNVKLNSLSHVIITEIKWFTCVLKLYLQIK